MTTIALNKEVLLEILTVIDISLLKSQVRIDYMKYPDHWDEKLEKPNLEYIRDDLKKLRAKIKETKGLEETDYDRKRN